MAAPLGGSLSELTAFNPSRSAATATTPSRSGSQAPTQTPASTIRRLRGEDRADAGVRPRRNRANRQAVDFDWRSGSYDISGSRSGTYAWNYGDGSESIRPAALKEADVYLEPGTYQDQTHRQRQLRQREISTQT